VASKRGVLYLSPWNAKRLVSLIAPLTSSYGTPATTTNRDPVYTSARQSQYTPITPITDATNAIDITHVTDAAYVVNVVDVIALETRSYAYVAPTLTGSYAYASARRLS
jgi:hypothetical protein